MKKLSLLLSILMLCMLVIGMGISTGAEGNVAKVGDTEYATIDEAVDAWASGASTLTLLDNVTLSDVITLKSTEHHTLNLGTYTMTAASGKNAIEIKACGTGKAERSALTINADATNPGGINAGTKSVIYYSYSGTTEDRPIIKINGGVFTGATSSFGTAGIYFKGTAARKAATLTITGGTFNCSINGVSKSKLLISGGTFNYSVGSQGDGTAYRLISGGKFKSFGFMTADSNNTKFWIGTSMGNSNVGVYVDDNGYLVVGGPVITEPGDKFVASSTNHSGWGSYLQYSSAKGNGLYYTSVTEAFADNNKTTGVVTVYTSELDMTDATYKGTIMTNGTLTITFAEDTTPAWKVDTQVKGKVAVYTEVVDEETGVVTRECSLVAVTVTTDSATPDNTAVGGTVAAGASENGKATLVATPEPDYYFVNWTYGDNQSSTDTTLCFDPATYTALKANFAPKTPEETPNASFTKPDQIVGLTPNGVYTVTVDGSPADYTANGEGVLAVQKAWYGKSIAIVAKATDSKHLDSEAQILELPVCYFITLNYGNDVASEEIKLFDSSLTYPAPKAIDGKIFMGWYSDEALTTPYDFNATVTENITLYAKYADYQDDLKEIDDAVDSLRNAASVLQAALDTKADDAVVEAALENLAAAVEALEQAKEDYIAADAKLKAELEDAIEKAKQEVLEATKPSLPYVGENGNWWIGDTDTGLSAKPVIVTEEANAETPISSEEAAEEDNKPSALSTAVAGTAIAGNSITMAAWTILKKKRKF